MIKLIISEFNREAVYGDIHSTSNTDWYRPYVGSIIYIKLFGLIWVRYKTVILVGKNH